MRRGTAYGNMSSSDRRRSSKWDLKEESHIPYESIHEKTWSGKADLSFHDRERRERLSPEAAGSNHSKWSVPEPLPGRRGSLRDDSIDAVRNRNLKARATWDGEDSYGTRMSPGLNDWRQQGRRNSPKNEWKALRRSRSRSQSRSRSRSPMRGFGRESGFHDRSRSRSGASAQICKDYASGRCRRGNHCQFLHAQNYEDGWERHRKTPTSKYPISHDSREFPAPKSTDFCTEFLKGGHCRRGASCQFAHDGASHKRNNERRQRDSSLERHSDHEPRRAAAEIHCKFFAAGNCRNGRYCRFSHQGQNYPTPDRSQDGRIRLDHDPVDVDKLWNKWGTSTSDAGKISEKEEIIGASDQTAFTRSISDSLTDHKLVESEKWKPENVGADQRISENWLEDADMSPEWNCKVGSSNQQEPGSTKRDPGSTEGSVRVHESTVVIPSEINESYARPVDINLADLPHHDKNIAGKITGSILPDLMISPHSFNQNGLNSNALPQIHEGNKVMNKPEIADQIGSQMNSGVTITPNNVSTEQLTIISASLAQFFANGQNHPQPFPAQGSHVQNIPETSSFPSSEAAMKTDSAPNIQSNESIGIQKEYNPIEAQKQEINNDPLGFFPILVSPNNTINGTPEIASKKLEEGTDERGQIKELEPGANSIVTKEKNGVVIEETKKLEKDKSALENDPPDNIDGDDKNDEGKKSKDGKGIRAFKFALVEFVKELLKPTWKEGQMSKDAYKNIVKKVVDKVTGSVQGANVPQTQEKIQQYLSFSKPKLTKLIQAYVEKFQKDK